MNHNIPYSFLDLAIIGEGTTTTETLQNVLKVAQHIEKVGFNRLWLAEHHNMPHIASSATSVLIGYLAGGTSTLRVGSGGVMLPNHPSLVIAEQFGTLDALYPGRIDLGLGRAPGTDQATALALRRNDVHAANFFPQQIEELKRFFKVNEGAKVRAFPGEGCDIPMWILGSSTDSAYLAAELGLPYAFASHFAPDHLLQAANIYRKNFVPSAQLDKPYFMPCVNAIVADTNGEAEQLATSFYKMFLGIIRNDRKPLQRPCESMEGNWTDYEEFIVKQKTFFSFIGDKEKVKSDLSDFFNTVEVEEIMITTPIYGVEERLRSVELFSEIMKNK
ncbi:LLM class flavin-dependent oxidoreductase [Myroides odoratimimus]|uniref:LLM class flavin-dependent oxidoreductase n=1 Tax=Myroides odoratimimus TaxID=76832 RepID=UPI0025757533|nr:LLM class flavin-dependent oxidoreductase [Myroides odoratimimus]MDM1528067.1 LLM class flavin-dependent oxidoreductase [Myroides odoratimimus]